MNNLVSNTGYTVPICAGSRQRWLIIPWLPKKVSRVQSIKWVLADGFSYVSPDWAKHKDSSTTVTITTFNFHESHQLCAPSSVLAPSSKARSLKLNCLPCIRHCHPPRDKGTNRSRRSSSSCCGTPLQMPANGVAASKPQLVE